MSTFQPAQSPSGRHSITADSIGDLLIRRLRHHGVRHVFGIPGDYILGLYDKLQRSPIEVVGTCQEDAAGFAADAYARVNGIGCCCVTYCVGGLSVANAIAGAYAEKSPVVVLSGSPGLSERTADPMLHHKIRSFDSQREIFAQFTERAVVIDDPDTACRRIDEAIEVCVRAKRPVYIELPRDLVDVVPNHRDRSGRHRVLSDPDTLAEAVDEIRGLIERAERPMILAGVEIHRHGMQELLKELVDRSGIPVAATLLGKSVISELHPNYIGVYEGAMGRDEVSRSVEDSDCLLMLGTFMTDVNLGVFTAKLDRRRCILIRSDVVQVHHHRYVDLRIEDLMKALANAEFQQQRRPVSRPTMSICGPPAEGPLTVAQLFRRIDALLEDDMAVICDVGLALFGAVDLTIHRRTEFIAPAYYTSMGFAVPASIGVACAKPDLRPVVLVGDGAFQMTGLEVSTSLRLGQAPIVVVLDNKGYTTERAIKDGPYNDIAVWRYEKVCDLIGGGRSWRVGSEQAFVAAWQEALTVTDAPSIIVTDLDPHDYCPALERLGQRLGERL